MNENSQSLLIPASRLASHSLLHLHNSSDADILHLPEVSHILIVAPGHPKARRYLPKRMFSANKGRKLADTSKAKRYVGYMHSSFLSVTENIPSKSSNINDAINNGLQS